jgi:excisionase family DNA binding protein
MAERISASQAAEALGVSRSRVLVLIGEGRLPAEKIGNQYVIRRADLAKVKDRKPGRPKGKGK